MPWRILSFRNGHYVFLFAAHTHIFGLSLRKCKDILAFGKSSVSEKLSEGVSLQRLTPAYLLPTVSLATPSPPDSRFPRSLSSFQTLGSLSPFLQDFALGQFPSSLFVILHDRLKVRLRKASTVSLSSRSFSTWTCSSSLRFRYRFWRSTAAERDASA